jgi:hypothetical protein
MTVLAATIEADLGVAPLLSQTVPSNLTILNADCGLPALPTFYINLYRAPANASPVSLEFARQISQYFSARYPNAA